MKKLLSHLRALMRREYRLSIWYYGKPFAEHTYCNRCSSLRKKIKHLNHGDLWCLYRRDIFGEREIDHGYID